MDNTTRTPKSAAKPTVPLMPVKGSWEDLLFRGQQLATRQNQEGGRILRDLIDRLARMPAASLSAGDHRLRTILLEAVNSLAPYLLYRQRYDETLDILTIAERFAPPEDTFNWRRYRSLTLIQSGAVDEGFALQREAIVQGDAPILWMGYVDEAIQRHRIDLAEAGASEAEHAVNRVSATSTDENEIQRLRGMLGYIRAHIAVMQDRTDEASAWMEYMLAQSRSYEDNLSSLYLRLVEREHWVEALKWTQRDQTHPMRSQFWQGYILNYLGNRKEAERLWQQVIKTDLGKEKNVDLMEYILSHYFMGDREGIGLGLMLNLLQRSSHVSSLHFFLTGLGWALRGDPASAHTNFQQALMQTQALALGHRLLAFWWRLCTNLIAKDALPQYAQYFNLSETGE